MAEEIGAVCRDLDIPYIFKASFDKANRTSIASYRGVGIEEGVKILAEVRETLNVPVVTDIHESAQASEICKCVDIIQIPALLSRQTDLLVAAAKTGKPVSIKKGQCSSPFDMKNAVEKVFSCGNRKVMLTERGSFFGYNNLVVDMRSLVIMRDYSPVIFDATHSVQLPGGSGDKSDGQREFVKHLASAAVGIGVDGIFMEIHNNPSAALCDGPNSVKLDDLYTILKHLKKIDDAVKEQK
jgi:2-dehydro-3-deoxyphosphooctonate aldolase (KDO 8-P synthase)